MTAPVSFKPSNGRTKTVVFGVVAAVVLIAVVVIVAVRVGGGNDPAAAAGTQHVAAAGGPAPARPAAPTKAAPAAAPTAVTAISPASGAKDVATDAALTVTYSSAIQTAPATPKLSPAIDGTWHTSGATMTFTPTGGWLPFSTEHVTATAGGHTTTSAFKVQDGDQVRLEQLLAELNYLPMTLDPASPLPRGVTTALAAEATTPDAVRTTALSGTLQWSWSTVPATLRSLWRPGHQTVLDQGAIMAFQSDHGMTMDGIAGPDVWHTLVAAVAGRQVDKHPYSYLVASETVPETLTVYREGKVVYTTKANTGVSGADTQRGTFPVYLRYASTTMSGTNVDGSKYVDPGIPWVAYFNGGDAVHGFVRPSYGFPQSNGCVELPISNAKSVWSMDPYGTLVTVTA
jgi:lipoprotein-anchoring transpeptidase ErfK/SrfK